MRSYTLMRRPAVAFLPNGCDGSCGTAEETIQAACGARAYVTCDHHHLSFPPPHEVWITGRVLRAEEQPAYVAACVAACAAIGAMPVRWRVEEMYCLDWDAFDAPRHATLERILAGLPGWLGARGLPRWYGTDETLGPSLVGSVEAPGLHVIGLCELETFEAWHRAFLDATSDLPFRKG
jgi:hypothetical protein